MSQPRCNVNGCLRWATIQDVFCGHHWHDVPKEMKYDMNREFQPGQGYHTRPSLNWFKAAKRAVERVNQKEKRLRNWKRLERLGR